MKVTIAFLKKQTTLYIAVLLASLSGVALSPVTAAEQFQSLTSIRLQSEAYIVAFPYRTTYPPRPQIGHLDSRLRLQSCPTALTIRFSNPDQTRGNTSLTILCPAGRGWKIHLPVRIDLFEDVVVAKYTINKGQIIGDQSITYQKTNISRLHKGFYTRDNALAQLQARRNIPRGSILSPSNLSARLLVRSGQRVTLILEYKGIRIKSSGQALQSASLGQRIQVRNSQSKKIVEGTVTGDSLVRVNI